MDIVANIGFGLLVLLGLSIVVFLHEAGHFLAARWAGVEVEAFAIGWGKVLWAWKPGVTEYRICLLPIGGYCKMKGEQDLIAAMGKPDGQVEPTSGSLFAVSAWSRIVISAAGPLVNWVTAVVLFVVLALVGTPSQGPESRLLLAADVDGRTGTAAEAAGLKSGDLVRSVDGSAVRSFAELQDAITDSRGKAMLWRIERDGAEQTVAVTPKWDEASQRPLVGIYSMNPPVVRSVVPRSAADAAGLLPGDRVLSVDGAAVSADQVVYARLQDKAPSHQLVVDRGGTAMTLTYVTEGPKSLGLAFEVPTYPAEGKPVLEALSVGVAKTGDLLGQMLTGLGRLVTGRESAVQSLSGPVGIVGEGTRAMMYAFGEGWDFGFSAFVNLLAFLSLALFLMNLLPIPALDGGSIVVSIVEAIRRRRLAVKTLIAYQQVGVFLVLGLLLFTTLNDFGLFGKV